MSLSKIFDKGRLHIDEYIVGLSISQWLPCPLGIWNLLYGMAILLNMKFGWIFSRLLRVTFSNYSSGFDFHGSPLVRDSLFHLRTPYMSLGMRPYDSLVLEDDKSSVSEADFNDTSMCMYAAILNQLRSITSGHTHFCQFENTHKHGAPHCFGIRHGRSHLGLRGTQRCSLVICQNIEIKSQYYKAPNNNWFVVGSE